MKAIVAAYLGINPADTLFPRLLPYLRAEAYYDAYTVLGPIRFGYIGYKLSFWREQDNSMQRWKVKNAGQEGAPVR